MSKCKINCVALRDNNPKYRSFEVTESGRVWPCCFISTGWDFVDINKTDNRSAELLLEHPVLVEKMKTDPNWNNLDYHSIDEILEDPIFSYHYFTPGWNNNDVPPICKEYCSGN
jgi:hypothetical protein